MCGQILGGDDMPRIRNGPEAYRTPRPKTEVRHRPARGRRLVICRVDVQRQVVPDPAGTATVTVTGKGGLRGHQVGHLQHHQEGPLRRRGRALQDVLRLHRHPGPCRAPSSRDTPLSAPARAGASDVARAPRRDRPRRGAPCRPSPPQCVSASVPLTHLDTP